MSNQQIPGLYVVAGSTSGAQAPGVYVAATGASVGGGDGSASGAGLTGAGSMAAGSASGTGAGVGTLTSDVLRDGLGALVVEAGISVQVLLASTLATVVLKTGLTSSALGKVTFSDAALTAGTSYLLVIRRSNGDFGSLKAVAT